MEPLIIALICAASFGAVVALSVFIRHLLLSRDKHLNDEAQRKALAQEAGELEKMREQMQSNKRFDSHYKVLGTNKDAIAYIDGKIEDIIHKKTQLVERYANMSINESGAIINGLVTSERKSRCDKLKCEIDDEITFYNSELEHLQQRRKSLWDTHTDLQEYLVGQEKARNAHLDDIFKQHSSLLEKVYIRHTENAEHFAKQTVDAGTLTFKMFIMAPIQFLMQYFSISSGIAVAQSALEQAARDDVNKAEAEINDPDTHESADFIDGDQYTADALSEPDDAHDSDSSDDSGSDLEEDSRLSIA